MNTPPKRRAFFTAFLAAVAVAVAVIPDAEAKGRTGSRRVGGSGRWARSEPTAWETGNTGDTGE